MPQGPSILVCGETFSKNLGDPIIAEGLSYLLRQACPNAQVDLFDFSLRPSPFTDPAPEFGSGLPENPTLFDRIIRKVFRRLSHPALREWWWRLFWRGKRERRYRERLKAADLLVFGGGKVLQDNRFDLPLKVYGVVHCAKEARVPTIFYGCGVGEAWSRQATRLFREALSYATEICLREPQSAEFLARHLPSLDVNKVRIVVDPAICISDALGLTRRDRGVVGIGVIAYDALRRHSPDVAPPSQAAWIAFLLQLAGALAKSGRKVEFYCNGAGEDQELLEELEAQFGQSLATTAPVPRSPLDLVSLTSGYSCVIGCRLHACVTALSLGIPTIAVKWDRKVEALLRSAGFGENLIEISSAAAANIAADVERAIARLDPARIQALKARAQNDVETMLAPFQKFHNERRQNLVH